mmetsp:Transcript_20327/g.65511  ORF Transcript_20327/g.65511 Transcript_20327/m.65511 type:complete len:212 (+) Transcript_20327:159-794(+)
MSSASDPWRSRTRMHLPYKLAAAKILPLSFERTANRNCPFTQTWKRPSESRQVTMSPTCSISSRSPVVTDASQTLPRFINVGSKATMDTCGTKPTSSDPAHPPFNSSTHKCISHLGADVMTIALEKPPVLQASVRSSLNSALMPRGAGSHPKSECPVHLRKAPLGYQYSLPLNVTLSGTIDSSISQITPTSPSDSMAPCPSGVARATLSPT